MQFDSNLIIAPTSGNPKQTSTQSSKECTECARDSQSNESVTHLSGRWIECRHDLDAFGIIVWNDTGGQCTERQECKGRCHNVCRIIGQRHQIPTLFIEASPPILPDGGWFGRSSRGGRGRTWRWSIHRLQVPQPSKLQHPCLATIGFDHFQTERRKEGNARC